MRWIAALVTASCLLVASGVRSGDAARQRDHGARIDAAAQGLAAHAVRRTGALPDLRIGAFVAPERGTTPRPRRTLAVASFTIIAGAPTPEPVTAVARGPPEPAIL